MADPQNVPPPPQGFSIDNLPPPPAGFTVDPHPLFGAPQLPPAQTPGQAQGVQLQNQRTQQEIQAQPLQNDNTRVNIAQGQTSIANTQQGMRLDRVKAGTGLAESFRNDPTVKAYREVMPQVAAAESARPDGAGDLTVIYSWAKAMDPTGSVRDSDTALAQSASGPMQKAQFLISQYHLQNGGQLPPEVRLGLVEEMRNKARQLDHQYSAVHDHYVQQAKANGLDPSIIGPHEGQMYQSAEEQYIRAHGGTPRDPAAPQLNVNPAASEGRFGDQSQGPNQLTPEQQAQDVAFLRTNPTPEQYAHFLAALQGSPNSPIDADTLASATARLKAIQSGARYNPAIAMDPRSQALLEQMKQKGGAGDAAAVAAGQGLTLNASDEIASFGGALGDALSGQGSLGDRYNVYEQANQGYLDYLQHQHPIAYGAGELGGGAVLAPITFGAETPAQLAALSGGIGAVAGFNGGQGGVGNRAVGAVEGGAAGAALGYAVPKGLSLIPRKAPTQVPPLVDPQTGALNQPLEAMSPGQRVVHAEEYGINLPGDAAGGRTAAVIGKGLDIMPGSAGVMEDARRATESQVAAASDVVASRFGNSRTMNEAGAELQRGANERIDRAKDVIGKAYEAIPISDGSPTSLTNTRAVLNELSSQFDSNPALAEAVRSSKIDQYAKALHAGDLSWRDLKGFRTRIGEAIGERRFNDDSATSDLRALYGALSEDMRNTAAQAGPGSLRAFERANNLNRQNEQMIQGALTRILGNDGNLAPEKAAAAVQAMTKGGKSTGDLRTLAQIKAATAKSGAWNEIASTLIRLGGQPANSAGRDFNPTTFVNWYADMAEPARRMLFGGTNSELRNALDGFVAVNQRLQKVNALRNTSNTAGSMTAAGTVGTMAASLTNPLLGAKLIGVMGGNYAMAKLWTNPAVVRLLTGYSKAVAAGNQNAVKSQIGRITALAATNPDLREPLIALQQRLLSAANDNVGKVAASPQNNQTNQQ